MFGGKIPKNTFVISLGFFFMYSAFDPMSDLEESIVEGFTNDGNSFYGSGYLVLSVFMFSFGLCAIFTPILMDLLRFKGGLFFCSTIFTLFVASNFYPIPVVVYSLAFLLGVCTSLLWSTGFALLSLSCAPDHIALNATVFWLASQMSYGLGSLYIFIVLSETPSSTEFITSNSRIISVAGLTVFSILGVISFQLVSVPGDSMSTSIQSHSFGFQYLKDSLKRSIGTAFGLVKDVNFSCLCFIFLFTGLSQRFMSVYNTSFAHTLAFNNYKVDSKAMVGLSGLAFGSGEVTSGLFKLFLLSNGSSMSRRMRLCLVAFLLFNTSHFLIILNLPDATPYEDSYNRGYINTSPNPYIALTCSFLIGASDSIYQSELFAIIGEIGGLYENITGMATVFYNFLQGIGGMANYLYAGSTGLLFQLSILVALNFLSILIFLFRNKSRQVDENLNFQIFIEPENETA